MTACRSVAQGEKRRNASRCESGGSSPAIHGEDGHRAVVPVIRSAESLIVDPLIVSPDPSAASTWICSIMASHPVAKPDQSRCGLCVDAASCQVSPGRKRQRRETVRG